jgi:hypothetical protein
MKTEVYSWRVSTEVKSNLERAARRRKLSLSAILDIAAREWLSKNESDEDDAARQLAIHKAAAACFGTINGGDQLRSANASQAVKQRLRRRYAR